MGWSKRNIEKTKNRNGASTQGRTVIKYITQVGEKGVAGEDSFQVYISPQSKIFNSGPASQSDTVNVYAFRGTTQLGTYVDESAFSSLPSGLTCTVNDNSTNQTTVTITATNALNEDGGTIVIPVRYPTDTYDSSSSYDASLWDTSLHTFSNASTYYSWTLVKPTTSAWNLDLTNENASINADKDGSIYGNATRPTCTAKLTRGTEDVSTAVYYIDTEASIYSSKNPQDVSINPSSGVMTFGSGFTFTGLGLEIPIYAKVDNVEKARKIMTVTKSLPGADGISRSYWLDLSADAIKVDTADVCHPDTISVSVWKQENESNPETTTECVVKWCYNSTDASMGASTYSSAITVDASKDYMTFKLYKDSSYIGESETVPILKDGKNGVGQVGPAGPVIRGPILWTPDLRRRFCAGSGNMATDSSYIDIVYYDPSGGVNYHYYRCTDSYTQSNALHTWSQVSGYWTQAEGEYDFIATQLLLANNAKIKFLTNNEFYLTDASGNIHGGGRAATADSSVIFWAGSAEGSTNINAAPFQVDSSGNITATSGTFAGFVKYPYKDVLELTSNPTFNKNSITRYATYTFDASTQYANLISRTIHHNLGYAVPFTRNLVLPFPTEDLNGFTYNILVSMYDYTNPYVSGSTDASVCDNACLHISVNNAGHQNDQRLYIDNYAFPATWTALKWTIEFGSATITCVPYYGNVSDSQASTIVGYRWTITQASGIVTADTGGNDENRYKHFASLLGFSSGSVKPIYEIHTYTGTRPSPTNEENIMFVSKNTQ